MLARVVMTMVFFLIMNVAAQAQEETRKTEPGREDVKQEDTKQMDEIVVTATKTQREVKEVPTNVTVITREDIDKYQARDLSDLLQQVPGFNISGFGGVHADMYVSSRGNQPSTRGALLMVNGIEYNNVDGYFVVQAIPLGDIERIEIVKNPASALYGNFGTGGIVNVITRKATKPLETKFGGSYGSFNTFDMYGTVNGAYQQWEYYFEGRHHSTDGWQDNSWESNGLFHAHATYHPDDTSSVGMHANYMKLTNGYPGTLTQEQFEENPQQTLQPYGKGDSYMLLGALFYEKAFGDSLLRTKLKYAGMDGFALDPDYFDFRGYNLVPEINYSLGHTVGGMNGTLLVGSEYRYFDYERSRAFTVVDGERDVLYMDRSREDNTWAVFLQEEIEPLKDLHVLAGARYDHIDTSFTDHLDHSLSFDESHDAWSPKAGVTYNYCDSLGFFTNYGGGFRNPSTASSGFSSNPDLKPELIRSYEAGARGRPLPWLYYNAAFFLVDTDDKIIRNGGPRKMENAGETRSIGMELGLNAQFKNGFRGSLNYTYANSTFLDYIMVDGTSYNGNTIPLVPEHLFGVGVGYGSPLLGQLDIMVNLSGERFMDNANTRTLDGYFLLDVKYRYALTKNVELFLNGQNLTDERYVQVGFGGPGWEELYPMPGVSLSGGVNIAF